MNGLTTDLLRKACRIFLGLAYPDGESAVPAARRRFWDIPAEQPLAELIGAREVCETLTTPAGALRGFAFRLGSSKFPHLKLQVVNCDSSGNCVFTVDTHDTLYCKVSSAEAAVWAQLQADNRLLKERIEREWDRQGLLTFNGLLRRELERH
jgi:hypothetical protein